YGGAQLQRLRTRLGPAAKALNNYSGLPSGLPANTPVGSDPMALAAQQCASSGLYYQVSTDGDISAALQALFQKVITTARLTH
ncbi:MAG TPA: hypothetical protein VHS81_15405, partial [Caulobacteraceae bacterium]|nr:hypothetical protein [Caulobacteraceae bacterium]